jgi:hypothetical protein
MVVRFEGREMEASVADYRCKDFFSINLYVGRKLVPLPDTFTGQYELVEATPREREMLRCWGYQLAGL